MINLVNSEVTQGNSPERGAHLAGSNPASPFVTQVAEKIILGHSPRKEGLQNEDSCF